LTESDHRIVTLNTGPGKQEKQHSPDKMRRLFLLFNFLSDRHIPLAGQLVRPGSVVCRSGSSAAKVSLALWSPIEDEFIMELIDKRDDDEVIIHIIVTEFHTRVVESFRWMDGNATTE
jgi:hypothetical protein